jgi:hypothetical protein
MYPEGSSLVVGEMKWGGVVIDEREKRPICIKQALYSRNQTK